jgi:hypothetical protein
MLVPSGVQVEGIFTGLLSGGTAANIAITSPQQDNYAPTPGTTLVTLAIGGTSVVSLNEIRVRTDTSSQIRTRSSLASLSQFAVNTIGWVDTRGRLY